MLLRRGALLRRIAPLAQLRPQLLCLVELLVRGPVRVALLLQVALSGRVGRARLVLYVLLVPAKALEKLIVCVSDDVVGVALNASASISSVAR